MKSWALYAFLACLIWGTTPIVIKLLLPSMLPLAMGFYRYLIAAVILAVFLLLTGRTSAFRKVLLGRGLMQYVILGFLGVTVFTIFFFIGVQLTTAGKASLLCSTSPIVLVVLAYVFLKEKINLKIISGVLLGFIGALFVIVGGKDLSTILNSGDLIGDILAFGAGISWAAFSAFGKVWTRNHEAYTSTSLVIFLGLMLMLPMNVSTDSFGLPISTYDLSLLLYLGIFPVIVGYFLWIKAFMLGGVSRICVFQFITPLVTVLLGAVILNEGIDIWMIIGFLLISSSIYLTSQSSD